MCNSPRCAAAARRLHRAQPTDQFALPAAAQDGPDAIDPGDLSVYRRVRDETRDKVQQLLEVLEELVS